MKMFFVLFMTMLACGCGKKGPLKPPEALVPAPVADLQVEQRGERLLVSWTSPKKEEGGGRLRDLAAFRLFRREVLPPGQDCEECPGAYRLLATVDLEYPRGVLVLDDRFYFFDGETTGGTTYRYKLFAYNREGASSRSSNRAGMTRVSPPAAPVVMVQPHPASITLQWAAVAPPPKGRITGYHVYRKKGDGTFSPLPFTVAPVVETMFDDTSAERGVSYDYAVTTVALVGENRVESVLSREATGALTDTE